MLSTSKYSIYHKCNDDQRYQASSGEKPNKAHRAQRCQDRIGLNHIPLLEEPSDIRVHTLSLSPLRSSRGSHGIRILNESRRGSCFEYIRSTRKSLRFVVRNEYCNVSWTAIVSYVRELPKTCVCSTT